MKKEEAKVPPRTLRQRMMDLLTENEMSAILLSQTLGIREKEVYQHLPHIARSAAARDKKLLIRPSLCLKCGYVFKNRTRFTRPGRCPKCKEEHLQDPAYRIRL